MSISEHSHFSAPLALLIQGGVFMATLISEHTEMKLSIVGHVVSITITTVTFACYLISNRKKLIRNFKEFYLECKIFFSRKPPVL